MIFLAPAPTHAKGFTGAYTPVPCSLYTCHPPNPLSTDLNIFSAELKPNGIEHVCIVAKDVLQRCPISDKQRLYFANRVLINESADINQLRIDT